MKRAFDIALSGVGLVVSAPLWLAIAIAIKLDDGGPVFFTQRRVGFRGASFTVHKFRSMQVHRANDVRAAVTDDPRITRVGRVLRATAMDELPQLWNILRGDMSFVGPRALAEDEVEIGPDGRRIRVEQVPGYAERHRVVPGLTGLTQVFASRDLPRAGKFRLDRLYVRNAGLWLDLRLIAISFWITCRGRWEVKGPKL